MNNWNEYFYFFLQILIYIYIIYYDNLIGSSYLSVLVYSGILSKICFLILWKLIIFIPIIVQTDMNFKKNVLEINFLLFFLLQYYNYKQFLKFKVKKLIFLFKCLISKMWKVVCKPTSCQQLWKLIYKSSIFHVNYIIYNFILIIFSILPKIVH